MDREVLELVALALSHNLDITQSAMSKDLADQRLSIQYVDQLQTIIMACKGSFDVGEIDRCRSLLSGHIKNDPILQLRMRRVTW